MFLNGNLRDNSKYLDKAVVQHRALNHEVDIQNAKIVHKSNSLSERLILESSLINKLPNFNICSGKYLVDPITQRLVIMASPRLPWPVS